MSWSSASCGDRPGREEDDLGAHQGGAGGYTEAGRRDWEADAPGDQAPRLSDRRSAPAGPRLPVHSLAVQALKAIAAQRAAGLAATIDALKPKASHPPTPWPARSTLAAMQRPEAASGRPGAFSTHGSAVLNILRQANPSAMEMADRRARIACEADAALTGARVALAVRARSGFQPPEDGLGKAGVVATRAIVSRKYRRQMRETASAFPAMSR